MGETEAATVNPLTVEPDPTASGAVVLVPVDAVIPLQRVAHVRQDRDYRLRLALKRLLRDFGLRCSAVCDADRVTIEPRPAGAVEVWP